MKRRQDITCSEYYEYYCLATDCTSTLVQAELKGQERQLAQAIESGSTMEVEAIRSEIDNLKEDIAWLNPAVHPTAEGLTL